MDGIRPFCEADIPDAAALYQEAFGGGAASPLEPLEQYFHEVFFRNPWRDSDLPSLVYEQDGMLAGFLGVIPRRVRFKGGVLTAAISTQLMVGASGRHRLAAPKLLQAYLAGPQDLSFTDGANESSRRMWKSLGGAEVPIYSICWSRGLEDVQPAGVPAAGLPLTEEELDSPTMLEQLPSLCATAVLRPEYDAGFLEWLFSVAAARRQYGPLCRRVVKDAGRIIGWYVCYVNRGGLSQVLQIIAGPRSFGRVLDQLFLTLKSEGSTAVAGRLDPQYLHEYSRHGCTLAAGCAVLAQASDDSVLAAIHQGDAVLSRLDGEWWNGFRDFLSPASSGRPAHDPAHAYARAHDR